MGEFDGKSLSLLRGARYDWEEANGLSDDSGVQR